MPRPPTRMDNQNRFKLGLFAMNCSGGLTMTKAPERWDQSWENNLEAARLADEAGLEFLLPIGRWHGYRGETDTEGTTWETLTWATGLLASTKRISAFCTLHVAFVNPVFAAKQMVTADHVGRGRFGVNIVSGWNRGEFDMFGVALREHDDRYGYSEEWLSVVEKIWSSGEPFDFDGEHFQLKGVLGKPKPYGGGRPMIMSAGASAAGRGFAARHADCLFITIYDVDLVPESVRSVRAMAPAGRRPGVYASGHLITRPTEKETQDYYNYIVHEMGDWEAADHILAIRLAGGGQTVPPDVLRTRAQHLVAGVGTTPVVGSYDQVAAQLQRLSQAGLDGMAVGLVNYIEHFPVLRDEILPRLERLGLRQPYRPEA
ncbi:MAG: hypothetical protein JWN93_3191 [Hyphomicrobiales bacterium]|nr:hypothetical protein [Hyphomicrobiales bacterium]